MLEWWEALALSAGSAIVGGVIALGVALAQHRLSSDEARRAEERQAGRDFRHGQAGSALEYLEVVKRYVAGDTVRRSLNEMYEVNLSGVRDQLTREEFMDSVLEITQADPDVLQLSRSFVLAITTTTSSDVQKAVLAVEAALLRYQAPGDIDKVMAALRPAEEVLGQFLVHGESAEPSVGKE
jgi:hypothetical protein